MQISGWQMRDEGWRKGEYANKATRHAAQKLIERSGLNYNELFDARWDLCCTFTIVYSNPGYVLFLFENGYILETHCREALR